MSLRNIPGKDLQKLQTTKVLEEEGERGGKGGGGGDAHIWDCKEPHSIIVRLWFLCVAVKGKRRE